MVSGLYYCYKCESSSPSALGVLNHCLESHLNDDKFACQQFMLYHGVYHLSETTVKPPERDVLKFNLNLNTINHYESKGFKIEWKRPCEPQPKFSKEYLTSLLENAMNRMDRLGRLDDFISLLDVIGKGTLDNNVAVHLCLDIGTFHSVKILSQMTYPKISMDWWLTVKIILKGTAFPRLHGCWPGKACRRNRIQGLCFQFCRSVRRYAYP